MLGENDRIVVNTFEGVAAIDAGQTWSFEVPVPAAEAQSFQSIGCEVLYVEPHRTQVGLEVTVICR